MFCSHSKSGEKRITSRESRINKVHIQNPERNSTIYLRKKKVKIDLSEELSRRKGEIWGAG